MKQLRFQSIRQPLLVGLIVMAAIAPTLINIKIGICLKLCSFQEPSDGCSADLQLARDLRMIEPLTFEFANLVGLEHHSFWTPMHASLLSLAWAIPAMTRSRRISLEFRKNG